MTMINPANKIECHWCGFVFHSKYRTRKYCSIKCRSDRHKHEMRTRYREDEVYRQKKLQYDKDRYHNEPEHKARRVEYIRNYKLCRREQEKNHAT